MRLIRHRLMAATAPDDGGVPPVDPPAPATPAGKWYEGFGDVGLRSNPNVTKYDSAEAMAKGHSHLVSMAGKAGVQKPKEGDPADLARFYTELGMRPENAADYTLNAETQLPATWDEGLAMRMTSIIHKHGGSQELFEELMGGFVGEYGAVETQLGGRAQAGSDATQLAIDKEYGVAREAKLDNANRALDAVMGDQAAAIGALVLEDGTRLGDYMPFLRQWVKFGENMHEDDPNRGDPDDTTTTMTPKEADAELIKLKADPEFNAAFGNNQHVGHAAALARFNELSTYKNKPAQA